MSERRLPIDADPSLVDYDGYVPMEEQDYLSEFFQIEEIDSGVDDLTDEDLVDLYEQEENDAATRD